MLGASGVQALRSLITNPASSVSAAARPPIVRAVSQPTSGALTSV